MFLMKHSAEIVASVRRARRAARRNRSVFGIHEDSEHRATRQMATAVVFSTLLEKYILVGKRLIQYGFHGLKLFAVFGFAAGATF